MPIISIELFTRVPNVFTCHSVFAWLQNTVYILLLVRSWYRFIVQTRYLVRLRLATEWRNHTSCFRPSLVILIRMLFPLHIHWCSCLRLLMHIGTFKLVLIMQLHILMINLMTRSFWQIRAVPPLTLRSNLGCGSERVNLILSSVIATITSLVEILFIFGSTLCVDGDNFTIVDLTFGS